MDPIEVTAHFDTEGNIRPLEFTWNGQTYPIESTGRNWDDLDGRHILVMIPGGRVFELNFSPNSSVWSLRPVSPGRAVA
jgi:hypothetical protein